MSNLNRIRTALLLCAASPLAAQGTGSATLIGTVTDTSNAAVAGAKITVVNTGTRFTSASATNAEGGYYVPYLIPGNYRLTIEVAGFKSYVRDGIELRINESPRINVQLEVGSVSESVNVNSATPLLETETAASGQVMDGEMVVKLPVMQKGIKRMTLYMPGLNVINGLHGIQTFHAPDHFLKFSKPEFRHNLTDFFGDKHKEINDVFRFPVELFAEFRVLCRHTDGTCVQMAFA